MREIEQAAPPGAEEDRGKRLNRERQRRYRLRHFIVRPENQPDLATNHLYVNVTDAAETASISRNYIRQLIYTGAIKATKQAGFWFIERESLDIYLASRAPNSSQPHIASNQ
jgi:hypothetical protein